MVRQPTSAWHLAVIKPRTRIVFCFFVFLFVSLALRLIFLQFVQHRYYQAKANLYQVRTAPLIAQRGLFLDRNGARLATNVPARWVSADPRIVKNADDVAGQLAPLLEMDKARLLALLTPNPLRPHVQYVSLKRHVPVEIGLRISKANLLGINVVADTLRDYPYHSLAANVLGITNSDDQGMAGLELSQNKILRGINGEVTVEVDKRGRFLPGTVHHHQEPVNGKSLRLTLDSALQNITESELARAVTAHGAESGVGVVLDSQTGDILALANVPTFDPNRPRPTGTMTQAQADALANSRRNRAVTDLYEPGSTLKTITASAVLQELGLGEMDHYVYCPPILQIGKYAIHEAPDALTRNLGSQNLRGILRVSSNVGMAQFGLRLGAQHLFEYERKYGFLDKPGSGLAPEGHSHLRPPDWPRIQLANISFGQGVSVTALQLASAYGAIANDGVLMRPHVIAGIQEGDKETPVKPEIIRQVLSPEVARAVRSMLGTVVESGTGIPAQIAGYTVGGKTGSAQIAGKHGYEDGHYVASFVGLYPLAHPRLVILCAIFKPQGIHWGATVAAPVVHNVAQQAMHLLQIPPDAPVLTKTGRHTRHHT